MSQELVAVDIDEVLSPLHDLVFAHHNEVYGTNYQPRHPSGKYYLDQFTGDSYEETKIKLKKFVNSEEFQAVLPLKHSVEAISILSERYKLVIITARQDFYEEFTRKWLLKHYKEAFSEIRFTEYVTGEGLKVSKAEICQQLGVSVLVDDHLENVIQAVDAGIDAVLFGDYPWNSTDKLPDNVIRCSDWLAVLEYFDARS